jgi:hypothetical protein
MVIDMLKICSLVILSMCVIILLGACTSLEQDIQTQPEAEPLEAVLVEEDNQTNLSIQGLDSAHEESTPESALEEWLPTPSETPQQARNHSPTAQFTLTRTATAISVTPIPTQSPTETPAPAIVQLLPTASEPPLPNEPATIVPLPAPGVITGRILFHSALPTQTLTLILEDQTYQVIQEIQVSTGEYVFANLPTSIEGYNILFTQSKNQQFAPNEVVSWAWIGPVPVQNGDFHVLPDLQIALVGLDPIKPSDGAIMKAGSITAENPLRFEWSEYSDAAHYWVELRTGPTLELVWRSGYIDALSINFDGVLLNGERISPGGYWWSVGARMKEPLITITSPLRSFTLQP